MTTTNVIVGKNMTVMSNARSENVDDDDSDDGEEVIVKSKAKFQAKKDIKLEREKKEKADEANRDKCKKKLIDTRKMTKMTVNLMSTRVSVMRSR